MKISTLCIAVFILTVTTISFAALPRTISYQGYVKDSATGVPVNTTVPITFSLYSSTRAGSGHVWRETQSAVAVDHGIYSVQLGSITPITAPFDVPYYLGVNVADSGELPLLPLSSTGYAFRAAAADSVSGNSIGTSALSDGSITTVKIAAGAVNDNQISGTISAAKLDLSGVQKKYARTAVVAQSGGDYASPVTAMTNIATWCGTPSNTNTCLLKIMPGTYDLGSGTLAMQAFVDIEGAGELATTITSAISGETNGTVRGASNAELRFLTVKNTAPNSFGVFGNGIINTMTSPRLTNVTVTASIASNSCGIYNASSSPVINNATVTASGVNNSYGIINTNSATPFISNSTTSALGTGGSNYGIHNNAASPRLNNVIASATGGSNNQGMNSGASSGAYTIIADRSTFEGSTYSIYNSYPGFTVQLGASKLIGPLSPTGTFNHFASYTDTAQLGSVSTGTQTFQTGANTAKGLVVKGNSATQSANLQEWQDNAGTPVASVSPSGKFTGDGSGLSNVALLDTSQTFTAANNFSAAPSFSASSGAPFSVASSSLISKLNAEMLGGKTLAEISATIPPDMVPLLSTQSGSGSGTVGSAPGGIFCNNTCLALFGRNTSVTLTASPNSSSAFSGWSGGGCSGTGSCTVTMDNAKSVTAFFSTSTQNLVTSRSNGGTITSEPTGIYCGSTCVNPFPSGNTVTLIATPDTGNTFTGWSGACSGTGFCTVIMDSAKSAYATFTANSATLNVAKSGTGFGTVEASPAGISCGTTCSASIPTGSVVVLTAIPDTTSTFTGWSGPCMGTGSCVITMNAGTPVTANFSRNSYPVTVSKAGAGDGSITSSPVGISCGATCSASYTAGQSITLTATPDSNSAFTGWSGACSGTGSCTVSIDAAKTVTAAFARKSYSLTLTRTGNGTITSSPSGIYCGAGCNATFTAGDSATLSAAPDTGYSFAGWSGSGCSGTGSCTVTMDAAKSVSATFTAISNTLSTSKGGTGSGTISSNPAGISCGATCSSSHNYGTVVVLNAIPDSNSVFSGWGGACSGTGSCAVTMNSAASVFAIFNLNTYQLTAAKTGNGGGTVTSNIGGIFCGSGSSCSDNFNYGSVVTLTANPDLASTFTGWSGGGCSGTGTCVVTMSAAQTVTATFITKSYNLTLSRTGSGIVSSSPAGIYCGSSCSAPFLSGSSITLTSTPDLGSTFAGWSGGGCTGTGICTITMDAAKNISAVFTNNTYNLSVTKNGTGSGSVDSNPVAIACGATCSSTLNYGTVVVLTATPDATSTFTGWGGACSGTGTCIVTMNAASSVSATFNRNSYQVTVSKSGIGNGTVTSSPVGISCGAACSAMYNAGSIITLTATPDGTSTFAGWSGACSGTGSCNVSIDSAKNVSASFSRNTNLLNVILSGSGAGRVTSSPSGLDCGAICSVPFTQNQSVTLTATPDTVSIFTGWSGACSGTGTCNVTMSSAQNVFATFAPKTYSLSVNRTGAGSVISSTGGIYCGAQCTGTFAADTSVTLAATPDSGATFSGWSGACTGTSPTCTFTMSSAASVSATFTYPLSAATVGTGSGTITSSPGGINCGATCAATYSPGTEVSLTPSPASSSIFAGWLGACSGSGNCMVTMDTAKNVSALFLRAPQTLLVSVQGGAGVVTSTPAGINCSGGACLANFDLGTQVTLDAFNGNFAGWSGACSGLGSCIVTMDGMKSVTATFN